MRELLRRFWLPEELPEADRSPKKIVVMGKEPLDGLDPGIRRRQAQKFSSHRLGAHSLIS